MKLMKHFSLEKLFQLTSARVALTYIFLNAQAGRGANLGSFAFRLFSLTSSALDHSATAPPYPNEHK